MEKVLRTVVARIAGDSAVLVGRMVGISVSSDLNFPCRVLPNDRPHLPTDPLPFFYTFEEQTFGSLRAHFACIKMFFEAAD